MAHGPIQIRNDEVARDIRELASLTGRPITEAVASAVRAALAKARHAGSLQVRRAAVRDAVRRFQEAPAIGPMPADEDFYDENGLPR